MSGRKHSKEVNRRHTETHFCVHLPLLRRRQRNRKFSCSAEFDVPLVVHAHAVIFSALAARTPTHCDLALRPLLGPLRGCMTA